MVAGLLENQRHYNQQPHDIISGVVQPWLVGQVVVGRCDRRRVTKTCHDYSSYKETADARWRRNGLIWPIRRFSTESSSTPQPSCWPNRTPGPRTSYSTIMDTNFSGIPVSPSHSGGDGSILILYCYSYLIIKFILLFIFSFFFS